MAFQKNEPEKAFELFEPQYQNWYRENLNVPVPEDWIIQFRPRFFQFLSSDPQWYSGYLLDQDGNVYRFGIETTRNIFRVSNKKIEYIHISDRWVDSSWSEVQQAYRRHRFSDFFTPILYIYLLSSLGSFIRISMRQSE